MKVIHYMAMSLDGYIAGPNDDTSWVSETEYNNFRTFATKIGNAIYGRRTYDLGMKENIPPLAGALNVVITHHPLADHDPYLFTSKSPQEILALLESKGFSEALVCGGGQINKLFSPFIDELYLDIEPVILGKGMPLFMPADVRLDLQLLEIKNLNSQTLQLHYKVKK